MALKPGNAAGLLRFQGKMSVVNTKKPPLVHWSVLSVIIASGFNHVADW